MKRVSRIQLIAGILTLALLPVISLAGNSDHGKYTIGDTSRFYIVTDEAPSQDLMMAVGTADQQFAAKKIPSKKALPIVYGAEKHIQEGDIVIDLKEGEEEVSAVEAQSYSLETTSSGTVVVTGKDPDGIFYGLNTLLQTFLEEGKTIDCQITDGPQTAERVLLLDCGRKYYSPAWIENLIKRMSWQKYTSLQLHFSDTSGMRLESRKYPWLNEPESEYITFKELEHICKIARKYHIEIIPELDTPGHMDYIIARYKEHVRQDPAFSFEYEGVTYTKESEGFSDISNYYVYRGARSAPNNTGIDLSNPAAVAFTRSLIEEYADFFAEQGSTKFSIGGDELFGWNGATLAGRKFNHNTLWNALEHWERFAQEDLGLENGSASDVFITYLNDTAARLAKKGYTCRVWNDEILRTDDQNVKLDPAITIVYWSNDYAPVAQLAEQGYRISNANTSWCYYVVRQDKHGGDIMDRTRKHCNAKNIYENWDPRNCANKASNATLIPEENYAGGYFAIWSDNPNYKDEKTVWEDTSDRTWANSARLWNPKACEALDYDKFCDRVDKIGTFPGYKGNCSKANPISGLGSVEHLEGSFFDRALRWLHGLFGK